MDTSNAEIFRLVTGGAREKNNRVFKEDSFKRGRPISGDIFEVAAGNEENRNPEFSGLRFEECEGGRASPGKRSKILEFDGEDGGQPVDHNSSYTSNLSTFKPAERTVSPDEDFSLSAIKNRLFNKGVDQDDYTPAPFNSNINRSNDSRFVLNPENNEFHHSRHHSDTSSTQNYGSHNSTLQKTIESNKERDEYFVDSPVKLVSTECSYSVEQRGFDNYASGNPSTVSDNNLAELPVSQVTAVNYEDEIEEAFVFNNDDLISPDKTVTASTVTPTNYQHYEKDRTIDSHAAMEHPPELETHSDIYEQDSGHFKEHDYPLSKITRDRARTYNVQTANSSLYEHEGRFSYTDEFHNGHVEYIDKEYGRDELVRPRTQSDATSVPTSEPLTEVTTPELDGFVEADTPNHVYAHKYSSNDTSESSSKSTLDPTFSTRRTDDIPIPNERAPIKPQDELQLLNSAIHEQDRISKEAVKALGSSVDNPDSDQMLEAERVLLKAQQTKIALYKRKAVLKGEQNMHSKPSPEPVSTRTLKITELIVVPKMIKSLTHRTYLLATFYDVARPHELQITRLIELHTLKQDGNGHIRCRLQKRSKRGQCTPTPLVFHHLKPDFQIDVHLFLLQTVPLVNEHLSPTALGRRGSADRKSMKSLVKSLRKRWGNSIRSSASTTSQYGTVTSGYSTEMSNKVSRFESIGTSAMTLHGTFSGTVCNTDTLVQVKVVDMPHGDLREELLLNSCLVEKVDNSLVRENWVNIFLPVIPPAWTYCYVKLRSKTLYAYRNAEDTEPYEILDLGRYAKVRKAEKAECFQKHVLRLMEHGQEDSQDRSLKTLLKFEDQEMMDGWLHDLRSIIEAMNSWRTSQ